MENARDVYNQMQYEQMKEAWKIIKANFTPLFDFIILYPNGKNLAAVFGKVWRYCQMSDGEMHGISAVRLGGELHMSTNTVQDCLDWLCMNGLLLETTEPSQFKTRIRSYKVNEDEFHFQNAMYSQYPKKGYVRFEIVEA